MERTFTQTAGSESLEAPSTGAAKLARAFVATRSDIAVMVARLTLGAVMFPHGAQKVLGLFGGYGYAGTMGFFTGKMGIPAPLAFLAIAAEFLGSLALLTGLLSRAAALGIASVMVVAVATAHLSNGFFMNWNANQKGEGFEYHLLALALAFIVILRGGGALSLDRLLTRRRSTRGL